MTKWEWWTQALMLNLKLGLCHTWYILQISNFSDKAKLWTCLLHACLLNAVQSTEPSGSIGEVDLEYSNFSHYDRNSLFDWVTSSAS